MGQSSQIWLGTFTVAIYLLGGPKNTCMGVVAKHKDQLIGGDASFQQNKRRRCFIERRGASTIRQAAPQHLICHDMRITGCPGVLFPWRLLGVPQSLACRRHWSPLVEALASFGTAY